MKQNDFELRLLKDLIDIHIDSTVIGLMVIWLAIVNDCILVWVGLYLLGGVIKLAIKRHLRNKENG